MDKTKPHRQRSRVPSQAQGSPTWLGEPEATGGPLGAE